MIKTCVLRSAAIGITAGWLALFEAGCAGNKDGTRAASATDAIEALEVRSTFGTLTHINRETQVVFIQDAGGELSIVAVGNHIILGRMEIGDRVRIESKGLLGFQLLEPDQDREEFSDDLLPAGVTFGRKVATTVEILKVEDEGESGLFRSKDGSVHTLRVGSKAGRTKLARLRPGDEVAASCTEKLSISLAR
jgi:hypothetical protein